MEIKKTYIYFSIFSCIFFLLLIIEILELSSSEDIKLMTIINKTLLLVPKFEISKEATLGIYAVVIIYAVMIIYTVVILYAVVKFMIAILPSTSGSACRVLDEVG